MKIEFFKKENNFKKKDFNLNPNFYWKIAVIFTFLCMALIFFFAYRLFSQIEGESVLPIASINGQIPMVKESRMHNALFYFTEKEQKSAEILIAPFAIVDPSL
ncbi:MAG: hypothetical protein WC847_01765 [Candidatus Paceibacterota bacterium]|jgi:hypothetical protein